MSKELKNDIVVSENINNCNNNKLNEETSNFVDDSDDDNEISASLTNEIIPTMTDDLLSTDASVANIVTNSQLKDLRMSPLNLNFCTQNQMYIILKVLKYVLILIFVHTCLGFILCVVFLIAQHYLYCLYTFLGSFAPIFLFSCISIKWDQDFKKSSFISLIKYFSVELVKYKHYIQYKECQKSIKYFEDSNEETKIMRQSYKEAIRRIEDFRLYIATNAILQGCMQFIAQIWVLIHIYDSIYITPIQVLLAIWSILLIFCCIYIYRSGFCDFRNDLGIYRVSIFVHFITMMSMFLYIFDIISDLIITVRYFYFEHFVRGSITLIFIIVPGIYETWHSHYRKNTEFTFKFKVIFTMILNLNPLFGYRKSIKLLLKTRKAELEQNQKHQIINYLQYIQNNFHVAYSRYSECFTESSTQLIIQLSFLLISINFSALQNEKLNILSSLISVLNVAVSVALFFRSKRIFRHEEDPLPILGMFIQFIGYLPVATRIVALSFLASVHPIYTFICIFVHWLMIFLWIVHDSSGQSLLKNLNNGGQAYIHTFTPAINTPCIEIIFQSIFFVENFVAMLVWGLTKYGRLTTNAIYLLSFAIVLPSLIGWMFRYLYRKKYDVWLEEYRRQCDKRNLNIC